MLSTRCRVEAIQLIGRTIFTPSTPDCACDLVAQRERQTFLSGRKFRAGEGLELSRIGVEVGEQYVARIAREAEEGSAHSAPPVSCDHDLRHVPRVGYEGRFSERVRVLRHFDDGRFAPCLLTARARGEAVQEGHGVGALEHALHAQAQGLCKGGVQVALHRECIANSARCRHSRPACDEGHLQATLIGRTLEAAQSPVREVASFDSLSHVQPTVVASEDEQCRLKDVVSLESGDERAYLQVCLADHVQMCRRMHSAHRLTKELIVRCVRDVG